MRHVANIPGTKTHAFTKVCVETNWARCMTHGCCRTRLVSCPPPQTPVIRSKKLYEKQASNRGMGVQPSPCLTANTVGPTYDVSALSFEQAELCQGAGEMFPTAVPRDGFLTLGESCVPWYVSECFCGAYRSQKSPQLLRRQTPAQREVRNVHALGVGVAAPYDRLRRSTLSIWDFDLFLVHLSCSGGESF